MSWNEQIVQTLMDIHNKYENKNKKWDLIRDEFNEQFNTNFNREKIRSKVRYELGQRCKNPKNSSEFSENQEKLITIEELRMKVPDEINILPDGSHKSTKLLALTEAQKKDKNFLLEAHGYDHKEWILTDSKSKMWHVYSKQDGIQTLNSSSIAARPKENDLDVIGIIKAIQDTKPIKLRKKVIVAGDRLLEFGITDPHFGISDYEYYEDTQQEALEIINQNKWKEIVFWIGSDLFHNNNHKGETVSGTKIEKVDMHKAWEDATNFFSPLIKESLENNAKVYLKYIKGNHDETVSWTYIQYLSALFPDCIIDDSFEERKIHIFHNVFIGFTHGDKIKKKELQGLFSSDFPLEWGMAKTREIHTGHLHSEDAGEYFGGMRRTLSTRNKTDQWHKDYGFIGAHKRFMLFEYDKHELKKIHYV